MVGEFHVLQKSRKCLGRRVSVFLENSFNFLANILVKIGVKISMREVFILFKIELNREVSFVFVGEFIKCPLKEGRFSCLPWCENDNIASFLDAIDEILKFTGSFDNVIFLRIHRAASPKSFHIFTSELKLQQDIVSYRYVPGNVYFQDGLIYFSIETLDFLIALC